MRYFLAIYFFLTSAFLCLSAQNSITVDAYLDAENRQILINQNISYSNKTSDTLTTIYLSDWNHAYSTKSTPLALRFEEEFNNKFHLAKSRQRGYTAITSITDNTNSNLDYERLEKHPDVLKIELVTPLLPNQSYTIHLSYTLRMPDATFTDYGVTKDNDFFLRYWYLTPVVYDGKWHYYSNKNLDDLYIPKSNIELQLNVPKSYNLTSELNTKSESVNDDDSRKTVILSGEDRVDTYLSLKQNNDLNFVQTDDFTLVSNIDDDGLSDTEKALLVDRITSFLSDNLGEYPHEKLLVTQLDYNKNPLYGLNQLPDILRPFPDKFQYELKLVKTALKRYTSNVLLLNPRKEHWLGEGIQIYYLMKYVETYYPDMKLFGSLAKIWGLRSFHAASLDFNFQYYLYSMEMARINRDQPLTTSKDSLIKFNANIAGKYKAGIGLNYLDEFADDMDISKNITEFVTNYQLKDVAISDFESFIKSKTTKDINWFFNDYVNSRKKIDFKIKTIEATKDSLTVTIKNKRDNAMPVSLFRLTNDSVIDKRWIENIRGTRTLTIPKNNTDKLVLDYNRTIPELNQRDNYTPVDSKLFNKPFQFRLLKDIEDPYYNQVFLMPLVEFKNIYDGLTLGTKLYNKTVLRKRFNFRFSPQYATRSKALTGSGTVFYTHNLEDQNLFNITYGISAGYQSFAQDAFFTRIRPSIEFRFRDDKDLRKDWRDIITARYVSISRNIGEDAIIEELTEEPDYGVFNLRYVHIKPGIINFERFATDFQIADKFSKLSATYEFRKLSKSNRNFNFRLFAGIFLENNTSVDSDFFSFALDRPTDYLFELNYLGRSEDTGLFSQQIIIAEGGFKSMLETPFANQWITTANVSTSIWRYIHAYGDVGLVKNKFQSPQFVYDSGIRLNLVEDYFEIFFPIYSNLGWEIAEPDYGQRIRVMFTVDPQVLLSLFTRKWY